VKNRLVFVDLLRGWATIIMIEVHVFNAFLVPAMKNSEWFGFLNYINGLVAPSFLFVAGFVFVISSDRKLEEFRTFGKAFWRQLSRIGLIWVIGYGLHLPFFSLYRTIYDSTSSQWNLFFQSDILHCIAIGLLIVFLGRIYIKRDDRYQLFLVSVGCALVLIAPFIWETDFSHSLTGFFSSYVNDKQGSMFPIIPWLGFLMFGAVAAFAHKRAHAVGADVRYFHRTALVATILFVAGSLLVNLPSALPYASGAIRANPAFFASRLGVVLLLLVACWYYAEWRKTERSFVLDVSKESLMVYTAHLLVIYGRFWSDNSPAYWYGGTFDVLQTIVATLGLMLLMVVMAKAWGTLKQKSMPWARYVSYATGIVVLIVFIVRKY
jgi:uncharacterized membrane protein